MKTMTRIATLLLTLVLILGLATTAFAQTITITPPTGVGETETNTYKIYKVFDANADGTNIVYKLVSGKTTAPAGFTVDTNGNVTYNGAGTGGQLTTTDIENIAAYVTEDDLVATITSTGSDAAVSGDLSAGYYYITTSTGSVVTVGSTVGGTTTVNVNDKNTVPTLDKTIIGASSFDTDGKKALAQVGTDVTYKVEITVGKGATNYVFHDKMDSGLTFKGNGSVAVTGVNADQYTIKETPDTGDTLTIAFADGLAVDTKITITYSATINSDALSRNPAKNTAWLTYGDTNTTEVSTEVYNAKFTVTKQDGAGAPLADAGFVIMNADGKYYKIANNVVSWVDRADEATENKSDTNGAVAAFTGLANGTYTLVEKTVPAGYNKAADSTFTVEVGDYTVENLEQSAVVTNNAGAQLPTTGGMGTTLFYTLGGILVVAAVVLLVTKKRMSTK